MPKRQTAKEFKWNCLSCLTEGISSVVWKDGVPVGANITCPECFWTIDRLTERVVDSTCRDIPAEYIPALAQPFWQCEACKQYNQLPIDTPEHFTADDLYCKQCETWQSDIPGHPNIVQDGQTAPDVKGDVSRSRWELAPEEIVPHVELLDAKAALEEKRGTPLWSLPPRSVIKRKYLLGLAAGIALINLGGFLLAPLPFEATVQELRAEVSTTVQQYTIDDQQGWLKNAPTSSKDYEFIRSERRKSGTILVPDVLRYPPDGIEHYTEEVYKEVGRRTVIVPKPVQVRVPDGTKEVCNQTFKGAVAVKDCNDVTKYRYETKMVDTPTTVIDKDWVDEPRTRLHQIPQDVFDTWGWWKVGVWHEIAQPFVSAEDGTIPTLDTSAWIPSDTLVINSPVQECFVTADRIIHRPIQIPCSEFIEVDQGDYIKGKRSRLLGVMGDLTIE